MAAIHTLIQSLMKCKAAARVAAFVFWAAAPLVAQPTQVDSTADSIFVDAATVAWRQFDRLWVPLTGLARATTGYDKLTPWDIGSVLAGIYSARVLGLVDSAEYDGRLSSTLTTMENLPLFKGVFHKLYNARTAKMAGRSGGLTTRGFAWSATDLGRVLIWLHIVGTDSTFRQQTQRIVSRLRFDSVVVGGYLYGEEITRRGRTRRFQEGRIGYEQYAARGFSLWGLAVDSALDIHRNAERVVVSGIELLRDIRGLDRLNSESFVLLGLETGWTSAEDSLARNVLALQQQRYDRTGIVTIASEDAVGVPPHYFYYYCVYCNGKAFVVDLAFPGSALNSPRWVSTKATFGWHALLGTEYTAIAVERVRAARSADGWSSGVLERSGKPTRTYDINTAAVVLEAAAYRKLRRPLLAAATARPQ